MDDKNFIDMKIRTWFRMNNIRKNGNMSKNDFMELADIFKREYNMPDSQHSTVKKWFCDGWDILVKEGQEIAKNGGQGGLTPDVAPLVFEINDTLNRGDSITEDMYAKAYEELVEINKDLFVRTFENMVGSFFDVFDSDNDGMISVDDMIRGFRCLGMQQDDATRIIFASMDREKQGKIQKTDYIREWIEFMTGNHRDAAIASVLCRQ